MKLVSAVLSPAPTMQSELMSYAAFTGFYRRITLG